jgi:hypothetical protein
MASKTWKIGEYAKGGVIVTQTKGNKVIVIGKDWDFSTGSRKSSNQSNAKEFTRIEVDCEEMDADRQLSMFLNDLTTSYYTDEIMKWIESKTKLNKRMFW